MPTPSSPAPVHDQLLELLAMRAGLQLALSIMPDDVAAAARSAAEISAQLAKSEEAAVEPWPPMRVPTADD